MAQTVKIPDSSNPFVVKINNDEYSYPAGTTQNVPDEVASVIASHNSAQPIPDKSAGLISWNDLKDRPFYDKSLVSVPHTGIPGAFWYKVSDSVPAGDYSAQAPCSVVLDGEKRNGKIILSTDDYYVATNGMVVVALKDNAISEEFGKTFPEKGTYFLSGGDLQVITGFALGLNADPEITWDGSTGEIKTLDEKFLPPVSGLIVKSSTANSTKKFKITVDDSGKISATEVT